MGNLTKSITILYAATWFAIPAEIVIAVDNGDTGSVHTTQRPFHYRPVVSGPAAQSAAVGPTSEVLSARSAGPGVDDYRLTGGCGACYYGILQPGYLRHRWYCHWKPWLHEHHWGYLEFFQTEPLGASMHAHFDAQVGKGQAAQLVLYHFDFYDSLSDQPSKLNSYGVGRLDQISKLFLQSPLPLIIERTPDNPELDEARRIEVIEQLTKLTALDVSADRVVVGKPIALGMRAIEAAEVYQNLLRQTQGRGGLMPSTGAGSFRPTTGFTPSSSP